MNVNEMALLEYIHRIVSNASCQLKSHANHSMALESLNCINNSAVLTMVLKLSTQSCCLLIVIIIIIIMVIEKRMPYCNIPTESSDRSISKLHLKL